MKQAGKILIVDDNATNRYVLKEYIEAMGHQTQEAKNGMDAFVCMENDMPDLVMLDIMMPEMDGFEVLERMKIDEKLASIPVIVISSLDDINSMVRCIENGADDFLTKPFNAILLKSRVSSSLEKKFASDIEKNLHQELEENMKVLKQTEQSRDGLYHMVVHDLNNPAGSILGFTDLCQMELAKDNFELEKISRYIKLIQNASSEIIELTRAILDVSRMEDGTLHLKSKTISMRDIILDIVQRNKIQAGIAEITIRFDEHLDSHLVCGDKSYLTRVCMNLMGNAIKHTRKGTVVNIEIESENDQRIISFCDSGPGVPEEFREKIFDKFFQITSAQATKNFGVGLGLCFCKLAIEASGGQIWIESSEGEGACFKFSIPTPSS